MQNYWRNWDAMSDIKQSLDHATRLLTDTSDSARLDAELLLSYTLNRTRAFFYAHPEEILTPTQQADFQQLITQRILGLPIAYLTQVREFWSLPLRVSKDTLIPRPETEQLVELTLSLLGDVDDAHILDLGTGSGAIALALASERPAWQILAVDSSEAALVIARENAATLNLSNVTFLCSNWFEAISTPRFSAILSNPPYIADSDEHLALGDVRFEPQGALVSGKEGLDALTHIIQHSVERLYPNGLLLLEHGFKQGPAVTTRLKQAGYQNVHCWQDAQGHDRMSGGWLENSL